MGFFLRKDRFFLFLVIQALFVLTYLSLIKDGNKDYPIIEETKSTEVSISNIKVFFSLPITSLKNVYRFSLNKVQNSTYRRNTKKNALFTKEMAYKNALRLSICKPQHLNGMSNGAVKKQRHLREIKLKASRSPTSNAAFDKMSGFIKYAKTNCLSVVSTCLCLLVLVSCPTSYSLEQIFSQIKDSSITRNVVSCLSKSLNLNLILENKLVKDPKKKKSFEGVNDVLFNTSSFVPSPQEYLVYPVLDLNRISSYRNLQQQLQLQNSPHRSLLPLSNAGFSYSQQDSLLSCDGCGEKHDLKDFTSDPAHPRYHSADGCSFINNEFAGTIPDWPTSPISQGQGTTQSQSQHNHLASSPEVPPQPSRPSSETPTPKESSADIKEDVGATAFTCEFRPRTTTHLDSNRGSSFSHVESDKKSTLARSHSSSSSSSTDSSSSLNWRLSEAERDAWNNCSFVNEELLKDTTGRIPDTHSVLSTTCENTRKKDHYGFAKVSSLHLDHLPEAAQSFEVLALLKMLSKLTVRILVKNPKADTGTVLGSGYVVLKSYPACDAAPVKKQSSKSRLLKKLVPGPLRHREGTAWPIYIQTDRHVIEGAVAITVQFNFGIGTVIEEQGEIVQDIREPGDNVSTLVCKTRNRDLYDNVNMWRQDFLDYSSSLPHIYKEAISKSVFMLSHPHGRPMHLSHGDCITVRYTTETTERGQTKVVKIGTKKPAPLSKMVQKMLVYTAYSCPGSSGAPVVHYRPIGQLDGEGRDILELDMWTHSGAEKKEQLGASTFKVCTKQELELLRKSLETANLPKSDAAGASNASSSTCSQGTVALEKMSINSLDSPNYALCKTRLETYTKLPSQYRGVLRPTKMALAGFFYTGNQDCVRCFCCNLGLKGWRLGDNVYNEHKRHNKNCKFLKAQLAALGESLFSDSESLDSITDMLHDGQEMTGASGSNEPNLDVSESSGPEVQVAEASPQLQASRKENAILQKQFQCHVCQRRPIKDLFLPCGDLYACTECANILTHCPCGKEILATVTTFFS